MAKQTRRMGRPPSTPGQPKRSAFNTRLRAKIKKRLEFEAESAGRSLSEEIEFRLERSLQQEADSGGRQLHGLLRLLAGAAEIIQERTGKSAFNDWDTWNAVQAAWKKLTRELAPEPPPDIIRLIKKSDEFQSKPVRPKYPPLPDIPNALLAAKMGPDREEVEAYEKDIREYERRRDEYDREYNEFLQESQKMVARTTESANLGRDVATELFPSSLNRE